MKKFLSLLFICVLLSEFSAQSEDFKSIITVSTFSPFRDQRYNVGYMRKLSERWWIGAEVGYGSDGITPFDHNDFKGKFNMFEIRPEVFYSLNPNSRLKHMISAEVFYLNHKGDHVSGNYYDENDNYYSFGSADYKRTKTGLNINYSIMLHRESSWFGFIPKIGFGIRQSDISYKNVIDREIAYEPTDGLPFQYLLNKEGSNVRFNFNIDIKIIFKF
jgi:hypothetical protein